MAGDPKYLQLLEEMKDLHIKKNAGYSGDNLDRWVFDNKLSLPVDNGQLVVLYLENKLTKEI